MKYLEEIQSLIKDSIKRLQKDKFLPAFKISKIFVEHPEDKSHGDYAANTALIIAKQTNKNPMKIAEMISENIKSKSQKLFKKIEIKKPGFINFFLSKKSLLNSMLEIIKQKEKYGSGRIGKRKIILIDYSSPNIAKPFGVGHLRSTIIGQAIYNIYQFLGWKTIGDNHLGDWGTQFGKLIVAIKKWNNKNLKKLTVQDLEILYVKFHQEAKNNFKFLEEAKKWFKKLEQGDQEAKKIWQFCVALSLKEFDKIYDLLRIKIDYTLGESFYQDKMEEIIKDAKNMGVSGESQGALVIPLGGEKVPFMLLKSDKATTYGTRDLATIKYRIKKWKPDLIVWEVGAEQKFYFKQLFKIAEMLGYGRKEQFIHIGHGMIHSKQGKFSTRKGETIHLKKILKEAIEKAKKIIDNSPTSKNLSEKEKQKIAEQVGIGAVKYNDLSQHYSKDIIFDWDKMLNLQGNSGPYLQYTIVRCQSVLKKAKYKNKAKIDFQNFNQEEENILRIIYKFSEIVEQAAEKFSPHLISNFAFELAQNYNLFYNQHRILEVKSEELKQFRLCLTTAVKQVLTNCLSLLGISIPKKM